MPTFEYKADAATPCLTLIPAPVTLEYTHGTAMIGSLVTIEKRIPEYAVTEDADETWETLPIEQLSSELERYCGVAVRTRRVLTATDEADAGANAADLELWFERYRVQWLSIGRYAELARIAHVVWSFADILRRGAL